MPEALRGRKPLPRFTAVECWTFVVLSSIACLLGGLALGYVLWHGTDAHVEVPEVAPLRSGVREGARADEREPLVAPNNGAPGTPTRDDPPADTREPWQRVKPGDIVWIRNPSNPDGALVFFDDMWVMKATKALTVHDSEGVQELLDQGHASFVKENPSARLLEIGTIEKIHAAAPFKVRILDGSLKGKAVWAICGAIQTAEK